MNLILFSFFSVLVPFTVTTPCIARLEYNGLNIIQITQVYGTQVANICLHLCSGYLPPPAQLLQGLTVKYDLLGYL